MPSAKIGDIDIYYEEQGQGEPVLLAPPTVSVKRWKPRSRDT